MNPRTNMRELYRQDRFPIFQNRMYDTQAEAMACPRGDIRLVEDLESGLVHNADFDPALVDYDRNYQNEQANSAPFRAHLDWVASLISSTMGLEELIEVGCGKGTFLEMLADQGASITGFDPTYEGNNPLIERHYFGPGLGLEARGLILRHVLEHIPSPYSFLQNLAEANGGQGLIYIEVPCLDWICDNRAWFDIFYEHVNYFRLADFHRMFGRVVASGTCFGGQYLYVVADLASLRPPQYDPADGARFPADLAAAATKGAARAGTSDVVWGGASKGVIYALLRARAGVPVAHVIDINPAKQGRYLAATGIRVQSPDQVLPTLPDTARILVMNPNYLQEIRQMSNNTFTYIQVPND